MQVIFAENKRRYGSPRIYKELQERGVKCGRHRIANLMKERGLRARAARKFRKTKDSSSRMTFAENLLGRQFAVSEPNRIWVGDITFLRSREGWVYLAMFLDLYSRRIVGWATSRSPDSTVALRALQKAINLRKPQAGLLVHTDRGTQFASKEFQSYLQSIKARSSMSRSGNCWDNAVAESFFHTLKIEAIYGESFESAEGVNREVFDYIEGFYNKTRRHSFLQNVSPESFERDNKCVA